MVPEGWLNCTLENLALVERGKFSARPRNDPKFYGGAMPFVQTGDIAGAGTYLTTFSQTLNSAGVEVSRVFKEGTILITIAANIGDTAITTFDVACPDSLVAIQPYSDMADVYWLRALLETKKDTLDSQATQNAQKNINLQTLKPLILLTPPLSEQKKIAQILSTWDKAITTTEQLLANSQQQKKALMQQLLTGKKRLLDDNGVRFSGKWKSYHLSELTKVVMGSSPKSAAYNEVELGLPLLQGNADIKNRRSAPRIYTSEITRECEVNDILLSVRAPVGTVALSNHHACIGRGIAAIRAKENANQDFIYQWLLWFEPKWSSLSQGSTFESINSADIKQLKVKSPEYKEQQKIAAVLISADHEIDSLQQKIEVLKQEKKALMQQLLTGKRRVKP